MNIGQLTAVMNVNTTKFEAGMNRVQAKMVSTGKKMQQVGKKMSMYVSLPLLGIGVAAGKMSMEFEASMAKITGLVGVAKEQVEGWKDAVTKMAAEVGVSATELADALFFITSAGIRGAEAMEVLEMSAKASAAGLGETKTVADLVTSAMNAYGVANLNAAQATDVLVATVREGKAEASEIAQSMGQVLPVASAMGVTFDQVGATIAAMTRTGTNAATAAIQLRGILASFLKPTQQAEEALSQMGTSSAEFRAIIEDQGLIAALTKLKDLQSQYGDEILGKVMPNIRALSGMLDVMGSNAADNIAIFEALKDTTGALDKAYESAANTTEHTWKTAMAKSKNALIAIGDVMKQTAAPAVEWFGDAMQGLADRLKAANPAMQTFISALGGIAVAAGPVIMQLGNFMRLLPYAIDGFNKIAGALKNVMKWLSNNPWMLLATAVAGLAVKLAFFNKKTKKSSDYLRDMKDAVSEATAPLIKEKTELNLAAEAALKHAEGTQERIDAVKQMQMQYPNFLANIDAEKVSTEQLTTALRDYNAELDKKIQKTAFEAMGEEQMKKLVEIQTKYNNALLIQKEAQKKINAEREKFFGAAPDASTAQIEGGLGYGDYDFDKMAQQNAESTSKFNAQVSDLSRVVTEQQQIMDAATQEMDNYKETYMQIMDALSEMSLTSGEEVVTPPGGGGSGGGLPDDEAMKQMEQIRDAAQKIREDYLNDIKSSAQERQRAEMTDWQKLNALWNEKFVGIQLAQEKELSLYQKGSSEYEAILSKWNEIYENALTEYELQRDAFNFKNEKEQREALVRQASMMKQATMTEREQLDEQLKIQKDLIRSFVDAGIWTAEEAKAILDKLQKTYDENIAELKVKNGDLKSILAEMGEQAGDIIRSSLESVVGAIAEAAGAGEGMKSLVAAFLGGLAEMAISMGKLAISMGVTALSIKATLATLGPAAIVAGAALVALGSLVKKGVSGLTNNYQGLATGGVVTSSGMFTVGERGPEDVMLPAGAAVVPNHLRNRANNEPIILIPKFKIPGQDLLIWFDQALAKNRRV